jgi:predicted SAM-dependent methyltransferase
MYGKQEEALGYRKSHINKERLKAEHFEEENLMSDDFDEEDNSLFNKPYQLHIGCGSVKLPGWVNIDETFNSEITDLQLDVRNGLPFEDESCELIYHEHFLEHLPIEAGVNFLNECHRVLKKEGVMRIAMPSLDVLIEKSYSGNWREQDWIVTHCPFIQTKAEMFNIAFRWWGHQWIYDREELHRRLKEVGFTAIKDVGWGESQIQQLRNLETRKDSFLICEVTK